MSGSVVDPASAASSMRPINTRMRGDLVVVEHVYRSEPTWVIKDPLGLKYHRLNEQEYTLLCWIDGEATLSELRDRFNRKFTPHRVTTREIQSFIGEMHKKSLVVSSTHGQGRHLLDIRKKNKRKELGKKVTNLLSIRWRGVDPEAFLNWAGPVGVRLFSPVCVAANLLFVLSALLCLGMNYERFAAEVPSVQGFFQALFRGNNWLVMGMVIGVTKVLHELGHAFCFKRYGGECHEIGVMILFFTPTLYCNTSDSWLLKNKWQRAAIGMAGIYIETFIVACAIYVWWLSDHGSIVHYVALNLILICSLSAILMNGNPFIKYDGYYVLSDLMEIPNLQQRAGDAVQRLFCVHALGLKDDRDLHTPWKLKKILIAYSVSAFCYRIFLTGAIAFILSGLLKPFGLENLGLVAAAAVLVGFVAKPFYSIFKRLKKPGTLQMVHRPRAAATVMVLLVLIGALFVPFPTSVVCDFSIEARRATEVHVEQEGVIVQALVRAGQLVTEGQPLFRIENPSVVDEKLTLQRDVASLQAKRSALMHKSTSDQQHELVEVEKDIHKHLGQLSVVSVKVREMLVLAPHAGLVCSASDKARSAEVGDDQEVDSWSGDPLHPGNLGVLLEPKDVVCVIADPSEQVAVLAISLRDGELMREDLPVTLLLDSTMQRLKGSVQSISTAINETGELNETLTTRSQSQIAQLTAAKKDPKDPATQDDQTPKAKAPMLQALVELDQSPREAPLFGAGGKARVFIGYRSVAWRLERWLLQTLRLRF